MAGVAGDSGPTEDGIEFNASVFATLLWAFASAVFAVGLLAVVFRLIPGYRQGDLFEELMVTGALLVFGAGTWEFVWRALMLRGVVVSINQSGFLDRRISEERIPWSAIEDVSVGHFRFNTFVLVRLRPESRASFPVRIHASLVALLNKPFGWDGYFVFPAGLKGSTADLVGVMTKFWRRYGKRV